VSSYPAPRKAGEPADSGVEIEFSRGRPLVALTLGGAFPAALAAAHAPWLIVLIAGIFCEGLIGLVYVFMEGARPAQEWADARDRWRDRRSRTGAGHDSLP
jgi:hypothetical protein